MLRPHLNVLGPDSAHVCKYKTRLSFFPLFLMIKYHILLHVTHLFLHFPNTSEVAQIHKFISMCEKLTCSLALPPLN